MADYLVDFPGLGIFDLPINRTVVSFELFGRHISIYWYGVIIALAFLLCIFLSMRQAKQFGMTSNQIADYYLLIIPLGMLGARLYYVVFQRDTVGLSLKDIFDTRSGGLAFYGGVIGGILAIIIMAKIKRHKLSRIFDFSQSTCLWVRRSGAGAISLIKRLLALIRIYLGVCTATVLKPISVLSVV